MLPHAIKLFVHEIIKQQEHSKDVDEANYRQFVDEILPHGNNHINILIQILFCLLEFEIAMKNLICKKVAKTKSSRVQK